MKHKREEPMAQELKAYTFDDMLDGDADIDVEYYRKDEVDAVLAEKDKVIEELKKQVHDYAQGLYVMQARGEKESRHHKYKRCFDKAEYCKVCSTYYLNVSEIEKDEDKVAEYRNISDWYDKWEERWLGLAEKFKEAK